MQLFPVRVIGASGAVGAVRIGRETRGVGVCSDLSLPPSGPRDQ